jgi:potassium uptake TrkH family protein
MKRRYHHLLRSTVRRLLHQVHDFFEQASFFMSILTAFIIIYDVGFPHPISYLYFAGIYWVNIALFTLTYAFRLSLLYGWRRFKPEWLILLVLVAFTVYKLSVIQNSPAPNSISYYGSILLSFLVVLIDSSQKLLRFLTLGINPALAFLMSFLFLAIAGGGLLLLPLSTVKGISVTDALFTSFSAVCVTGLSSLDTATEFTRLGKFFILALIQLGALGILSFTSFFGFLYRGEFSLQNQLFLKDFVTSEKVTDTFKTLFQIIVTTLLIELLGAVAIFFTVNEAAFSTTGQQIRFSIFHSVSAFCNAGFSTVPNGLYNTHLSTNYSFQWVICFLIIAGGIGFSIMTETYYFWKHYFQQLFFSIKHQTRIRFLARSTSANTSMVLVATAVLLVGGFVLFGITEAQGILQDHTSVWGKITTAFFASVTTRTAGFNTFDLALMQPSTILTFLLLMWIGASPGSTGGGIKTTTFSVAILNIFSLARGKEHIEYRRRQIPSRSVRRAFAVMLLSLLVIGLSVFLLTLFEPKMSLTAIAFESFSAFSTVGLSLGITPALSDASKITLIVVMFLGRVGTFTLFVAFIRQARSTRYTYPSETIFIN